MANGSFGARWAMVVVASLFAVAGCAGPQAVERASVAVATDPSPTADASRSSDTWVGVAPASDAVLAGEHESLVAVWVDVPKAERTVHVPSSVAIVIDTSGSMQGDKIRNARTAAARFVEGLADGDRVSLLTFSDTAEERVAPVVLDARSRATLASAIDAVYAEGGTNLFEGVRAAGLAALGADDTFKSKRVVLISDGLATVGDTSKDSLALLGEKAAEHDVQITSIGVGLDYDEKALDLLAMNSSGRLYHVEDSKALGALMEEEMGLLSSTRATDAFIEIFAAPDVEILGVEGARATRDGANVRVPLGSMYGGQHREFAVRVRTRASGLGERSIVGVRMLFVDPSLGRPRVHESIARVAVVEDAESVESQKNRKASGILALIAASRTTTKAIASIEKDDFAFAGMQLEEAERTLKREAANATDAADRQRLEASAARLHEARVDVGAAAAAPPAAAPMMKRSLTLKANDMAMDMNGL